MSGHYSSWIGEASDPLDGKLHETVADLKAPTKVPHSNPVNSFERPNRMALNTKGYPVSKTERFLER